MRFPSSLVRRLLVGLGFCGLALPVVARAEPAADAADACAGKQAGDPCGLMKLVKPADGGELERQTVPGACQADECCDLDYSQGSPPRTTCHACLVCAEGPPSGPPAAAPAAAADSAEPAAGVEPPRAGADEPPAHAPSERRGCRLGVPARDPDLPWWVWGGIGVFALRRSRR